MELDRIAQRSVITISPRATIQEAAKVMRESHVGELMVVDDDDVKTHAVGILTDRDIVVSTVAFGISPETVLVEELMSPNVVTASIHDSLPEVLRLMKEHGIRRIPLVEASGAVEGIICVDDVVEYLAIELGDLAQISEQQRSIELSRLRKTA